MSATLVWATPEIDLMIARIARVSAPANQGNDATAPKLLGYCLTHKHLSPFEMASVCIEINTSRDIARQMLRHRSFSFQEFSQRYADVSALGEPVIREARMQDHKNRQNSMACDDEGLADRFEFAQRAAWKHATSAYQTAIEAGIAKEQARAFLPEGMTPSRLYMAGTVRSWLTYCALRRGNGTQREHMDVANDCWAVLQQVAPVTCQAFEGVQ